MRLKSIYIRKRRMAHKFEQEATLNEESVKRIDEGDTYIGRDTTELNKCDELCEAAPYT